MADIKRVLVPVSFAPSCERAMELAARIAKESGAKLYVMNVYRALTPRSFAHAGGFFPKSLERDRVENTQRLDKFVKGELKKLKLSLDVEEMEINDKHPEDAIIEVAKEKDIDLIVLGHHEESALEHMLFGRNIHKIVDGAPCDVIITKTYLFGKKAA